MAGYLGARPVVVQVDGYQRTEAESRYVNVSGDDFTGHLDFNDDAKARFGNSDEMHIYTESSGSGYSYIQGDNIVIRKADQSTNYLTALGGVVTLCQHVGVGTSSIPSANSAYLTVGTQNYAISHNGFSKNSYFDGSSYKAITNDAGKLIQMGDDIIFYHSPTVGAGTTQTQETLMKLEGDGDVIIPNGNVSIGDSTLSTYNTSYPALELGASASIQGYTGNNGVWLQSNLFMNTNGQWTSKSDDFSAMLELYDGNFNFYNTASGTGTRTLLRPMTIKQDGKTIFGYSSGRVPVSILVPHSNAAVANALRISTYGVGGYSSSNSSNAGAKLQFGQYDDGYDWVTGSIASVRTGGSWGGDLVFYTNNDSASTNETEVMRIDNSKRVLVGKSSSNYATEGVEIRPNEVLITKAGQNPLSVRNNAAGGLISLNTGGNSVGSISSEGGYLKIVGGNGTSVGSGLLFTNTVIAPRNHTGGTTNGTIDLGYGSEPFKDIHIGGRVKLGASGSIEFGHATSSATGTSSSSTLLDHYEEGTFTPTFNLSSGSVTMNSVYNTMSYTRVGRLVTVFGLVITASASSPGGHYLFVDNLPYTSCNLAEGSGRSGGGVFYWNGSSPHVQPWEVSESSDRLTVYMGNNGANNLTGGMDFYFSCTYQAP